MLAGYFDDSGTHDASPVVVWGGLLGTEDQWAELEYAWGPRLRQPLPGKPPLKRFHLADCRVGEGEFRDYSQAERDHITYLFRSIIIGAKLFSISSTVCRADWDELIIGKHRDRLGDAESPCFLNCIQRALVWARRTCPDEKQVSLTFDLGRRTPKLQRLVDRVMEVEDRDPPEIVHIGFGTVTRFLPLQAADVVATETFWAAQQWLKDGKSYNARQHFQHYLSNMIAEGLIADREVILGTVAQLKRGGIDP